jgi:hypothetical protein
MEAREADIAKLKAMRTQLGYHHGVFILIRTGEIPKVEELLWLRQSRSKPGGPLCYIPLPDGEPQFLSGGGQMPWI